MMKSNRHRKMDVVASMSGRAVSSLLVVWLSLAGAAGLNAASNRAATITFIHKERSLKPGEIVLIKAKSTRLLKSLKVEALDRDFPAFNDGGGLNWSALVGIDLETKPGRYAIKLTGVARSGKNVIAQKTLWIAPKKFPTRTLEVDERYVNPPAEEKARIEEESARVKALMASITPEKFWRGAFRIPVTGEVISSFGKRNIYNNQPRSPHTGTDFRGDVGTPIRAPNAGRVVLAADLYYSGNTIIIDHGFGLYSYLGHMSKFSVGEGDFVKTSDVIGRVGATGRVTGPHLHWSVRIATTQVDPMSLISALKDAKGNSTGQAVPRKKRKHI
jgi:murein DD-endopeptidase MepM/ murein hydrolase activator NlpD